MNGEPAETGTTYTRLYPGDVLHIGPNITISIKARKLCVTAPKSLKVSVTPAKPIDMGDSSGLQ